MELDYEEILVVTGPRTSRHGFALVTQTRHRYSSPDVQRYETWDAAVRAAVGQASRGATNGVNGEVVVCEGDFRTREGDLIVQSCLGHVTSMVRGEEGWS